MLNISQLAVYSEAKELVQRGLGSGSGSGSGSGLQLQDGLPCHVLSALVSGLASTTASVPLDTVNP